MDLTRTREIIERLYAAFNARAIEEVLDRLTADVVWANGMQGGHVHGRDAVREYWQRQFALISSTVEPVATALDGDGRVVVDVHQVIRSAENGRLLADTDVVHVFTFAGDRIARFDIR